jgi:hypothetical protein
MRSTQQMDSPAMWRPERSLPAWRAVTAVLWRRLRMQGDYEHLRWLSPAPQAPALRPARFGARWCG